jgi:signal transduction histidine kinase
MQQVGAVLVDEAAKSVDESPAYLRKALELRLTRDIRRLDFVALIDSKGEVTVGNVPILPRNPIDAKAHFVNEDVFPDPQGDMDPAIFVARRRADGGILLLGRSLREDYDLQETLLRALVIALLPTILLILAIGAWFAHRASQRFKRVHDAIVRIMNGDLDLRLPLAGEDDIGKVARAVNLMLDEIARLLDHLKSAGNNIAHDLRTPLAVARAKLERALDNETGTEQLREALEVALVQIEKVSMTISAILRISAVEQGAREKQFKDFDLAAVCSQLLDFYEPLAESKSVTMIVDVAAPVPVRGDQDLMREAVSNLIDNAIKFTGEGRVDITLGRSADGALWVAVSDSGPGIPEAQQKRVFEPFEQLDSPLPRQRPGGIGLGLALVRDIAGALGGRIELVSRPREGSTFTLVLPAGQED